MKLEESNVLIFGTGLSGIAAANLLQNINSNIILFDGNTDLVIEEVKAKLSPEFNGEIVIGELSDELLSRIQVAVLSPGVPTDLDIINKIRETGITIIGEIELAYYFSKGKIAAITGTNGKTTTTTLLGEIMKTYYENVFVVGNIGIPYTKIALETTNDSVIVAEMSSFQLETIKDFRPNVSAILNISPDHLNRHHTMENYILAKLNITINQKAEDVCVLNYEDEVLRNFGKSLKCKVIYFSSQHTLLEGIYLQNENIIYSTENSQEIICDIHELNIFGRHSYENVMAAVAMALSLEVPVSCIRKAITSFVAVEHRIEFVTTKNGVKYYNDSKGTNPDASMKAIESMEVPTYLIAGGYDKGSDFDDWIKAFNGKIKRLLLIGQTSEKIAETARANGFEAILIVKNLQEAVTICYEQAIAGECVLLSPACASWGMFKNYEERGHLFKEYVKTLGEDN